MSILIVAVPMFDSKMTVKAYRLSDHNTELALDVRGDFRGKEQEYRLLGLEAVQNIGIEPFSADLPLYIDVNGFHVITGMAVNRNIPCERLILTLSSSTVIDDDLIEGMKTIKELGYGFALEGYPRDGHASAFFEYADSFILDYEDDDFRDHLDGVEKHPGGKHAIISNLPSREAYNRYAMRRDALFAGNFYRDPVTEGEGDTSPLKVNALQLLREINEDDFELQDIAKIVERDPSLSISLLRFLNSAAVGLVNKVQSINSAVAILGQKEIKRWATVAISVGIAEDRPSEITKVSLLRAKFAENLAGVFSLGVFQDNLFMAGLFSMLDIILEKPMDEAIREVALNELVRDALVDGKGKLSVVMDFIRDYERADWNSVAISIINNSLDGALVGKAFTDALIWYHELLDSIDSVDEDNLDQLS